MLCFQTIAMALNKRQRIQGAANVTRVFSNVRPLHGEGLSLRVLRTNETGTRYAVTVPIGVAPRAVERNTLRRRITECLRTILSERTMIEGVRVVVTARTPSISNADITKTLVLLFHKSGILQQ